MGKKLGACCFTIKRTFKEQPTNGSYKKSSTEKKKRKGDSKSFISFFKEPSSIEDILGEADNQLFFRPKTPIVLLEKPISQKIASPKTATYLPSFVKPPPRSSTTTTPKVTEIHKESNRTSRDKNLSATRIQAAYRGHMARRSFRCLGGLVRLQEVVRGHNVNQQTTNALKEMQKMVRVQSQIHTRRVKQNPENNQQACMNDKEVESALKKYSELYDAIDYKDWDNSILTKEEVEEKLQKKTDAATKRERAMSYAYSLQKSNAKSGQSPLDSRTNVNPSYSNYTLKSLTFDNLEYVSNQSSRSLIPVRAKTSATNSAYDEDSVMSYPQFSSVSSKAKVGPKSNLKERSDGSPSNVSKRRSLSPLNPKSVSRKNLEKQESSRSIGESVDSSIVGRKPFNRFV